MKAEEDKANLSTDNANDSTNEAGEGTTESAANENDEGKKAAEEEEAKTMTLDEWKAQRNQERQAPKFNVRKAGEGSDLDPKWKKTYAYKKEKETHEDEDEDVSPKYCHIKIRRMPIIIFSLFFTGTHSLPATRQPYQEGHRHRVQLH